MNVCTRAHFMTWLFFMNRISFIFWFFLILLRLRFFCLLRFRFYSFFFPLLSKHNPKEKKSNKLTRLQFFNFIFIISFSQTSTLYTWFWCVSWRFTGWECPKMMANERQLCVSMNSGIREKAFKLSSEIRLHYNTNLLAKRGRPENRDNISHTNRLTFEWKIIHSIMMLF